MSSTHPNVRCCASAVGALLALAATTADAATAQAQSGFWGWRFLPGMTTDTATWRWFTPGPGSTITWESGDNETDGVIHPKLTFGPEPKFAFPPGGGPAPRAFTGFGPLVQGAGPSTVTTSGMGSSASGPGALWGTNYSATWTVQASGTGPDYYAIAKGFDPFAVTQDQLDAVGLTGTTFDLYFHLGLDQFEFSQGSASLEAQVTTPGGVIDVLSARFNSGGVGSVSSDPGVRFFALSDFSAEPTGAIFDDELFATDIESLLAADLSTDLELDAPLALAVLIEDFDVSGGPFDDGELARISVGVTAVEAIPVPAALPLLATALALLGWRRRRPR